MTEVIPINGAYSTDANGWVSDLIALTGDTYLEVTLPSKGRIIIKKGESEDGPFPKALITPWAGPEFRIRIHHGKTEPPPQNPDGDQGHYRYIRIFTSETPTTIQLAKI